MGILYEYHRQSLRKKMSDITAFSITCDFWCNKSSKSFLCLTAHYFDQEFEYKSTVLSFSAFHERHISIRVANTIQELLEEYKIHQKLICITTDGASNMKAMAKHLNVNNTSWVWCFVHRLHLVVNHALGFWLSTSKQCRKESDIYSLHGSTSSSDLRNTTSIDTDDHSSYFDDSLEGIILTCFYEISRALFTSVNAICLLF